MIKENQAIFNRLNIFSDGLLIFISLPLAYWIRFSLLPDGISSIPLRNYMLIAPILALAEIFTYAAFGLYQSFRQIRLREELTRLLSAAALDMVLLLSWLFIGHGVHYSRLVLGIFYVLSLGLLAGKRLIVRRLLRNLRRSGHNLKHVLIIGAGKLANQYLREIHRDRALGFEAVGYVADAEEESMELPYLGTMEELEKILETVNPDEAVCALEAEQYFRTRDVLEACEQTGVKLSIIPYLAEFMQSHPQFDDLNGIPMLNVRRVPLDNFAAAFTKRAMDIIGSFLLLVLLSPIMLICAAGVRLSSPGPVFFSQERVGLNKQIFKMHKFRSMRVNDAQDTAWSQKTDSRRTRFGSILRKYSLDELPQFFDVFIGNMSLVGPRPEIPHFVEQFKSEIPLYMIRHQVRPGITGWAQINGLRGDTSIKKRIEYDIYYIENWSLGFDIQILLATVFKGKFVNDEQLK